MTAVRDDELPREAGRGTAITPVPASSVILLRGNPMEVLLLRRTEASSFVPGSWIFPGGALDASDRRIATSLGFDDELTSMKICAIRETFEECGIWLGSPLSRDPGLLRRALETDSAALEAFGEELGAALPSLVLTSRWVTPEGMPKRYDTFFFVAEVAADAAAHADGVEATDALWITPDEALQRQKRRELPLLFPTIRNLEALIGFDSIAALVANRARAAIEITRPVLRMENGKKRIILPGEP